MLRGPVSRTTRARAQCYKGWAKAQCCKGRYSGRQGSSAVLQGPDRRGPSAMLRALVSQTAEAQAQCYQGWARAQC